MIFTFLLFNSEMDESSRKLKKIATLYKYVSLLETTHKRMPSSWLLRHLALVRTDVSEEPSASITRVTRIGD
jgi:hypothetical protein